MKLLKLSLENFGIYGGNFEIDLAPKSLDQFQRPIVLFSGKNGVGKTTMVEAIRLCLHGSLAISNRVNRSDYEFYLRERIFKNNGVRLKNACLELVFEYVSFGIPRIYKVKRSWRLERKKIIEVLDITDNGVKPDWLHDGLKESFLRELVPPAALDLFFLDGEQLEELTNSISNPTVISSVIKSLFGLHLADQLEQDLDIFISRQLSENGHQDFHKQLIQNHNQAKKTKNLQIKLALEQQRVEKDIGETIFLIREKEQQIVQEGGEFIQDFDSLRERQETIVHKIEETKKSIQHLCSGLLPFAISPDMLSKVASRLQLESTYKEYQVAKRVVRQQNRDIVSKINDDHFWGTLGLDISKEARTNFTDSIQKLLQTSLPQNKVNKKDILFHASDHDKDTMLSWIEDARSSVPKALALEISEYSKLKSQFEEIKQDLARIPPEERVSPLYEELHRLREELDELNAINSKNQNELSRLDYQQETNSLAIRNTRESIQSSENLDERVQLASRTQTLLDDYSEIMLDKRISLLEDAFVIRFNTLCRKESFIESIHIDRKTFVLTLERNNNTFLHQELSAGETQLFAVAFIWALHDVSGLPMPMVFDTPLARLDTDHRDKMLSEFLPKACHQMLLLATDAEIDQKMIEKLSPVLSHGYKLSFDNKSKSTKMIQLTIN